MSNPEPANIQLSRRSNPKRDHDQVLELKKRVRDENGVFFNISLPVKIHGRVKLYAMYHHVPMGQIMGSVLEKWVRTNLVDIENIKKISLPDEDLSADVGSVIWLEKDVHTRIKMAASIQKIHMRELAIPVLGIWVAEYCQGPDYSDRRVKAISLGA